MQNAYALYVDVLTNITKMSKKITLTLEELEKEIEQAFVHGQGNGIMIEAGLERNEREDYTSSVMRRLNQKEDE
tara:strand:+ start:12 stop:233 length:222 start_codon:yes stop_codon:yes gene_type:complete